MKKNLLSFLGLCVVLTLSLKSFAQVFNQQPVIDAVQKFISSLNAEQKIKALRPYADTNRTRWSNLPMELWNRDGIRLDDLTEDQRMNVHNLLRQVLSDQGYLKILYIMDYDQKTNENLKAANNPIWHRYGQEKFWTWIFGSPSLTNNWGFKFEGHHISINMTFSPKGVSCTPHFTGINPALTSKGITAGKYIMNRENESGKSLFNSLSSSQKSKALVDTLPFTIDVRTQTGKDDFLKDPRGLKYNEMNAAQKEMVWDAITAWAENFKPAIASQKLKIIKAGLKKSKLVWLGTGSTDDLHYYCIQGPDWIVELATRDQGLQHFHTLYRIMSDDFGSKL